MEFTLIVIALCSYFSVKAWVNARQKERQAFYRAEAVKRVAEMQGNVPESVLSMLRAATEPERSRFNLLLIDHDQERKAFHRSEILRNLAAMPDGAASITQYLHQEEVRHVRERVDASKLGGLVTTGAGIGLLIFLRFVVTDEPVYLVGLIPILVGASLLTYALIGSFRKGPGQKTVSPS
jgi:hypothetical protein